jgi:aminoglycoside phosphotransferase (APT) family kinase protein
MGELQKFKAERLAEKIAEVKLLEASNVEKYEADTQTDHNFRTEDYFIKIEKYFNQRERTSVEPVVLENIDIKASTPELVDYGNINGYIYRIFKFMEGKSLDEDQEQSFEDLDEDDQVRRIRQVGKALAEIHESKAFDGFGNIDTVDGEIIGTSSTEWSEGLKDIQYFWHHYVGGEPFEEIEDDIENYYDEKEEILNQVEQSVLLHQEPGFHNLLFHEKGVSVIDWESAGAGDPLLDVIVTEVILFWFQDLREELRENFREAYLSVREIKFDEELIEVYRLVQLSRLLMIFDDDEDKVESIRNKIIDILN